MQTQVTQNLGHFHFQTYTAVRLVYDNFKGNYACILLQYTMKSSKTTLDLAL